MKSIKAHSVGEIGGGETQKGKGGNNTDGELGRFYPTSVPGLKKGGAKERFGPGWWRERIGHRKNKKPGVKTRIRP